MLNAGDFQEVEGGLRGLTAAGAGSASQLVQSATSGAFQVRATAGSQRLIVGAPFAPAEIRIVTPLAEADYPVLAGIWDNDDDALFDRV
jgi:hypothetical protein